MGYVYKFQPRAFGYDAKVSSCVMLMIRYVGLVLFLTTSLRLAAQQALYIYVDGAVSDTIRVSNNLDSTLAINRYADQMWMNGYLYFGLDSTMGSDLYFHSGERLDASRLRLTYNDAENGQTPKKTKKGLKGTERHLQHYIQNGFPFAAVQWDSVAMSDYTDVYYSIDPGPQIVNDSISFISNVDVKKGFLATTLGIEQGELFSESKLEQLPDRISRLDFLRLKQSPQVAFEQGKAYYFLDLAQNETNSFEGVLGLLPRQATDQKLLFTGYLDLQLHNLFRSGKSLEFNWNRFADQSQELNLHYKHPYFLKSRLFLETNFELLKQDTTFLTQSWLLAAGTAMGKASELSFSYQTQSGSLITPSPRVLANGVIDYQLTGYSIGLQDVRFDYHFPLSTGFRYSLQASVGNKTILKNPSLDNALYDSLNLKTLSFNMMSAIKYQLKLAPYSTLYHEVKGHLLFNDQLLRNELERLGGLQTIRGFNERFFFAQHFINSQLELRQYFELASYLLVFYDTGHFRNLGGSWTTAHGFGAGLNLDTKTGLFTFVLGLGTTSDIPVDPTNLKIHIGYTSRF